jgi:hypothetical protein
LSSENGAFLQPECPVVPTIGTDYLQKTILHGNCIGPAAYSVMRDAILLDVRSGPRDGTRHLEAFPTGCSHPADASADPRNLND